MAFQATKDAPAYALKFWKALESYNLNDTSDRSGIHGIERQIWSVSNSTGIDFEDLCQETFRLCAEGFGKYKKSRSGLNTWIRWQARAAARNIGRQGTVHRVIDGKQETVNTEILVEPETFSGEPEIGRNGCASIHRPYQELVDKAILECYSEDEMDNEILLCTEIFNGHTVRELAEILVKYGKTRGVAFASREWGTTPKKILDCIQRLRDGISS